VKRSAGKTKTKKVVSACDDGSFTNSTMAMNDLVCLDCSSER
jgi:hypothetical protein